MSMNFDDPKTRQILNTIGALIAGGSNYTLPKATQKQSVASMNRLSQKARRKRARWVK